MNRPIKKDTIISTKKQNISDIDFNLETNFNNQLKQTEDSSSKLVYKTKPQKIVNTKYDEFKKPSHEKLESSSKVVYNTNPRRITKENKGTKLNLTQIDNINQTNTEKKINKSRRVFKDTNNDFSNFLTNVGNIDEINTLFENDPNINSDIILDDEYRDYQDQNNYDDQHNTNKNLNNLSTINNNPKITSKLILGNNKRIIKNKSNQINSKLQDNTIQTNNSNPVKLYSQHSINETNYNPTIKKEKNNQTNIPVKSRSKSSIVNNNSKISLGDLSPQRFISAPLSNVMTPKDVILNNNTQTLETKNNSKVVNSVKIQSIVDTKQKKDTSLEPEIIEHNSSTVYNKIKTSRVVPTVKNSALNQKNKVKIMDQINEQNKIITKQNLQNGLLKTKINKFKNNTNEVENNDEEYENYINDDQDCKGEEDDVEDDIKEVEDDNDSNNSTEEEYENYINDDSGYENVNLCDEENNNNLSNTKSIFRKENVYNKFENELILPKEESEGTDNNEGCGDDNPCDEDDIDYNLSIIYDKDITWDKIMDNINNTYGIQKITINSNGKLNIENDDKISYELNNIKLIGYNYTDIIELNKNVSFNGNFSMKNLTLLSNCLNPIFETENKNAIISLDNVNIFNNIITNINNSLTNTNKTNTNNMSLINIQDNLTLTLYLKNNTNIFNYVLYVPKLASLNLYIDKSNIPKIIGDGNINITISSDTIINNDLILYKLISDNNLNKDSNITIKYMLYAENILLDKSKSLTYDNVQLAINDLYENINLINNNLKLSNPKITSSLILDNEKDADDKKLVIKNENTCVLPNDNNLLVDIINYDGAVLDNNNAIVPINPSEEEYLTIWLPDISNNITDINEQKNITIQLINITNSENEIYIMGFDELQLINGENSFIMNKPYQSIKLLNINNNWFII
ncbi:MAG: hypothetical protein KIT69_01825 [Propionibacteriaceae bacterium]|nr:hypothetical protein [Propionibacteriaceae bacterium]